MGMEGLLESLELRDTDDTNFEEGMVDLLELLELLRRSVTWEFKTSPGLWKHVLGEICLVHIFRSILINSSSVFNDFLTSIYANVPLRSFSIFLIFFSILFIYI